MVRGYELVPATQVNIPLMARRMEEVYPELWRICYPKIYREPAGGKWSPARLFSLFASTCAITIADQIGGRAQDFEFLVANHVLRCGLPIYWLTEELGTALSRTRANMPIPWFTQKMPTEAGVLMMPRGLLGRPGEGSVAFVAWGRFQPGVAYPSPFRSMGKTSYEVCNGGVILLSFTEAGNCVHWNIPLDLAPELFDLTTLDEHSPISYDGGRFDVAYDEHDRALAGRVAHFVFMTSMALADRPRLLTPAVLEKRVQRRGEAPREFWSPNILGADYKIQTKTPAAGEHRSPVLHLVRGFWREQAHGPARSLRTPKWIDPFWRGGKEDNERS